MWNEGMTSFVIYPMCPSFCRRVTKQNKPSPDYGRATHGKMKMFHNSFNPRSTTPLYTTFVGSDLGCTMTNMAAGGHADASMGHDNPLSRL